MKKIFLLIAFMAVSFTNILKADGFRITKTTGDENRYELLSVTNGSLVYAVKFDKWTGDIWVLSNDGVGYFANERLSEEDNKENIYQLMSSFEIGKNYLLNTKTGDLWKVNIKGKSISYEKQ